MSKKPAATPNKIPVKLSMLKSEDKDALRKEARASVLAEMEQDARDAFFKQAMADARREHMPAEQFVHMVIDTAPYVPHIMIDGVQYFNGYGYDVERRQ